MKGFRDQHWREILKILLPCAFTAVGTFYTTIMAVGDRVDTAEALFHQQNLKNIEKTNTEIAALKDRFYNEIEAVRSECNKDKAAITSHISKIENGMSRVEETVYEYLKPSAEAIGPLKTGLASLNSKVDSLKEQYYNDMKFANSRNSLEEAASKYMQANELIQQEKTPPQTVDKAATADGTKIY